MKYFDWDKVKNQRLRLDRDIGFEDVVEAINSGGLLETIDHPKKAKYLNQKMYVVKIEEYVFLVPFVTDEKKIFLKTIFPSRKATKKYLSKKEEIK